MKEGGKSCLASPVKDKGGETSYKVSKLKMSAGEVDFNIDGLTVTKKKQEPMRSKPNLKRSNTSIFRPCLRRTNPIKSPKAQRKKAPRKEKKETSTDDNIHTAKLHLITPAGRKRKPTLPQQKPENFR